MKIEKSPLSSYIQTLIPPITAPPNITAQPSIPTPTAFLTASDELELELEDAEGAGFACVAPPTGPVADAVAAADATDEALAILDGEERDYQ